jgi:hypothetical protein
LTVENPSIWDIALKNNEEKKMSIAQTLINKWQGKTNCPEVTDEQSEDAALAASLKAEYKSRLSHGTWMVEFTKVDGTPTTMECTLDPRHLPAAPLKEGTTAPRAEAPHLIHAYSLDRQGWRSFTVANVKAFYQKAEVY